MIEIKSIDYYTLQTAQVNMANSFLNYSRDSSRTIRNNFLVLVLPL